MATQTTNLGLTLPEGTENVSRTVINTNNELIDAAFGGVRQLPAVTSTDNGKFLTVVDGAWAATTMQAWTNGSY